MIKIWELIYLPESWQHLPWFQRQRPYFEVFLGTPYTQRAWTPAIEIKPEIRKYFIIRYSNRAATLSLYFDSENDWLFNTGVLERLFMRTACTVWRQKGCTRLWEERCSKWEKAPHVYRQGISTCTGNLIEFGETPAKPYFLWAYAMMIDTRNWTMQAQSEDLSSA